jgi:hypothetical protein
MVVADQIALIRSSKDRLDPILSLLLKRAAKPMKTRLRTVLSLTILSLYGFGFVGCNKDTSPKTGSLALDEPHDDSHDHEHDHEHDHDDEHEHDHPAHGPNGGHMIELGGEAKVEWMLDDELELFSIMFDNVDKITGVQMKTNIEGTETAYEFEKTDTPAGPVYGLKSPELATAVKMGEAVKTELVVTTEEGELTGGVVYHAH